MTLSRQPGMRTSSLQWPRLALIALFMAVPLLYFIFLPVSYSFDGTVFSQMLRYGLLKQQWLAVGQVHHLLYFPLAYWLYRALQFLFGYRVLEFFHLQLFSMLFGMATLVLVERLLKKLGMELLLRAAGVAIIAFSYAFWLYSVDAEAHIPGLFFTMAGIHLLLFRKISSLALAGAACCLAAAAGFHLANMLAVIAALSFLLVQRTSWKRLAQFGTAYASFLFLLYGAYFLLSHTPLLQVFQNTLFGIDRYSGYHVVFSRPISWATALTSLTALKKALVAGSGMLSWAIAITIAILLLLGARIREEGARAAARKAFLLWPLPYLLFFSWWDPGNMEFKIQIIIPLLLIAIMMLSRLKPFAGRALGSLLAGSLLAINLASGIAPLAEIGNNRDYQVAIAIRRATPDNAQVLITGRFEGYGYGKIYIPYFANREVLILDWLLGKGHALPDILAELSRRTAAGRPLYTLEEIAVPGKTLSDLLDFHRVKERQRALFVTAVRYTPVAALPDGHRLFLMEFGSW